MMLVLVLESDQVQGQKPCWQCVSVIGYRHVPCSNSPDFINETTSVRLPEEFVLLHHQRVKKYASGDR